MGKGIQNAPQLQKISPPLVEAGLYAPPILYATFRDGGLHITLRIPALHAIEGYAPRPSSSINSVWGIFDPAVKAVFMGSYATAA